MPRFLLQARHQMRPLLHADDHGLLYSTVSCMCVTLFTISLVYFVRPRKEETRVQSPKKRKEKKEMRTHSFARVLFLLRSDAPHCLTSTTGLLAAYSALYPRKEDPIARKKERPDHGERRLSMPCACTCA